MWPDGPQDEDRARLLGCLLAKTELELAAVESAAEDGLTVVGDAFMGWLDEVGPDRELMLALLAPRLERTAFQLLAPDDPEADNTPPTQFTAWAGVMTAAAALGVHMHGRREDADGVRRSLGRVESCLIELLQAVYDVRVTTGPPLSAGLAAHAPQGGGVVDHADSIDLESARHPTVHRSGPAGCGVGESQDGVGVGDVVLDGLQEVMVRLVRPRLAAEPDPAARITAGRLAIVGAQYELTNQLVHEIT
ncbi:hypothetical protein [Streptomyces sp. NPDC048266]|uniref:hypothetical protein n=1 Tax=Streptomyces sp. NPDC048266 TaxID=3155787 RepID=UPI0034117BB2